MTDQGAQNQDGIKVVVVDITRENPVKALDPKELIRITAYESLAKKIHDAVKSNWSRADNGGGGWNVFFIDGTRGSGKSTFLQTVIEELHKDKEKLSKDKICDVKLERLAYVDPTMIQTGEHILLSLLASLDKKVKARTRCLECSGDGSYDRNGSPWESWRVHFQNIANGLALLGTSCRKRDFDTEYFDEIILFDEKLNNAGSGLSLKEGLAKLFKTARELLGVDAFLVGLDDVDTNFDIGWEVLETIRRYGDIPGLIFLVTGDLQLYTHLVRDRHFRNFSDSVAKNDEQRIKERARMVDHLEQQYLLKIFPLHQRTQLVALWELLQESNDIAYKLELGQSEKKRIGKKSGENAIELQEAVEIMLTEGLSLGGQQLKSEIKRYVEYFLRLPVRSVLQILTRYHNDEISASNQSALAGAMRSAMIGSLYKQGIDVEAISNDVFGKLVEAVFDVTLDGGDWDTGYYLRPDGREEYIRSSSFVLSAEVARACRGRPDRVLRYLLQGPGSVSLFAVAEKLRERRQGNERELFKEYFGLGREATARDWALRSPSVLQETQLENSSPLGIGCGMLKTNVRKPKDIKAEPTKINVLTKLPIASPLNEAIRSAVSCMLGAQENQFLSFFNLLGAIEVLLEFKFLHGSSLTDTNDEIREVLKKLYSGSTVSVAHWLKGFDTARAAEEEDSDDETENEVLEEGLSGLILKWFKFIDKKVLLEKIQPSSLLLGKIWARTFFGLSSIAGQSINRSRTRSGNIWKIMSLNISCFLNAVLTEETLYGQELEDKDVFFNILDKISRKNPSTSLKEYKKNFYATFGDIGNRNMSGETGWAMQEKIIQRFPLFVLFASCPLLRVFELYQLYEEERLLETGDTEILKFTDIWDSEFLNFFSEGDSEQKIPPVTVTRVYVSGVRRSFKVIPQTADQAELLMMNQEMEPVREKEKGKRAGRRGDKKTDNPSGSENQQ